MFEDDLWLERCETCGAIVDVSEISVTADNCTTCIHCE